MPVTARGNAEGSSEQVVSFVRRLSERGRLKPGDRLRFMLVSVEEAQQAYLARERDLAMARAAIELRYSRGTT